MRPIHGQALTHEVHERIIVGREQLAGCDGCLGLGRHGASMGNRDGRLVRRACSVLAGMRMPT